jgi:hypothetical protein
MSAGIYRGGFDDFLKPNRTLATTDPHPHSPKICLSLSREASSKACVCEYDWFQQIQAILAAEEQTPSEASEKSEASGSEAFSRSFQHVKMFDNQDYALQSFIMVDSPLLFFLASYTSQGSKISTATMTEKKSAKEEQGV